jgi:V/A-type H+-transporting ATPase subunit F
VKFAVIGDANMVLGFRLVGIEGLIVKTAEETEKALADVFAREDIGVVVISERLAASVRGAVDSYMFKKSFPLIIEVPDHLGPMEGRLSVRDLIRRAVGIHL